MCGRGRARDGRMDGSIDRAQHNPCEAAPSMLLLMLAGAGRHPHTSHRIIVQCLMDQMNNAFALLSSHCHADPKETRTGSSVVSCSYALLKTFSF